jgi:TetR/AcrR family transcriptional repressor of bet genes
MTASQIALRAGGWSPLAHHYFGSKDQIFLDSIEGIRTRLAAWHRPAKSARERLQAIVAASFAPRQFERNVVAAWLTFHIQALITQGGATRPRLRPEIINSNLKRTSMRVGRRSPSSGDCRWPRENAEA